MMVCSICKHPKRKQIEKLLIEGVSLRTIADQLGPSKTALIRHQKHVGEVIQAAKATNDVKRAVSLVDQLAELHVIANGILDDAVKAGNGELALKALDRRHKQIELSGRLAGEFKADQPALSDAERADRASAILNRGKLRVA